MRDAGLVGDSGWVPVDRHTMETRSQAVFAIGDGTGIPLKLGKVRKENRSDQRLFIATSTAIRGLIDRSVLS